MHLDAGNVLFGRIGREIFTFGSIVFALSSTSGQLLSGQIALNVIDSNVCQLVWLAVFAVATFLCALPRTLEKMSWLSAVSFTSIVVASLVGMICGGLNKDPSRVVQATIPGVTFYNAFLSVTNIIFAYAGHFAFFAFISEMKNPKDCVKAIWALQGFSIVFYTVFAVVFYTSFGNAVASPSFSSLPPTLAKVTYGLALPNFLIAGVIYTHVAAKILFIRFFRNTRHVHSNTVVGTSSWVGFCFLIVALAWVLAEGVPNFSDLLGMLNVPRLNHF
jgi:amino acid permease